MTRKKAELHLEAKVNDKIVHFYHLLDAEKIEQVPRNELERDTAERIKGVSTTPTFGIYKTYIQFAYADPGSISGFDHANVLIEARLPYCLHLPNGFEVEIPIPDSNAKALIIFQKEWTAGASEGGIPSDNIDFYADDTVTHFHKATVVTPNTPIKPEQGWDPQFTGRNIEKIKDQNGTFRFSRIYIQFDPDIGGGQLPDLEHLRKAEMAALLDSIGVQALNIVNRIIDCYRYVTKQEYVERLGHLSTHLVYFRKENQGFYPIVPLIEGAVMNRSKREIDKIRNMLVKGVEPPIHELLALDARSALNRKAYTLAIVESFQAFEIMVENYLILAFINRGVSQQEYEIKLDRYWKTKERLNILLKETKGRALNQESLLWDPWCNVYDKVRNEVIHQGKQATQKEAEATLSINQSIISWLDGLA